MDALNLVTNLLVVALTLAVVVVASKTLKVGREAARDSKKTTEATQATVAALENMFQAMREVSSELSKTAAASREAAEIARATQEADERYRHLEQLRQIGRAVERILMGAIEASRRTEVAIGKEGDYWQSQEQGVLRALLVGVGPPLPKCEALAGAFQIGKVIQAAMDADAELKDVFRDLGLSF